MFSYTIGFINPHGYVSVCRVYRYENKITNGPPAYRQRVQNKTLNREVMKMEKTFMKNVMRITNEELEKVSGGYPGIAISGLPGIPFVPIPVEPKDEPRDGGATGGW